MIPDNFLSALQMHYDSKYDYGVYDSQNRKYIFLKDGIPFLEFSLVPYGLGSLACVEFDYAKKLIDTNSSHKPKRVHYRPKCKRM